jgi:signal peptidase
MTTLVLAVAATVAFLAVGPHLFGYRTTVSTTSTAPGIEKGDVVVSVPVTVADVRVGDVLTLEAPAGGQGTETRRVVAVRHDASGRVEVLTRGDADTGGHPRVTTLPGDTVWRTTHVVHHLGEVVGLLRAAVPQTWPLWGALGLAVLAGLRGGRSAGATSKEHTDV